MTPSINPAEQSPVSSELMLLSDGRILAHHLTPELAHVLRMVTGVADPNPLSPELPESDHS